MKAKTFRLIIFGNVIVLLGIFLTQLYWVREAYFLLEEQFDSSVRIAMKGVNNQLLTYHQQFPSAGPGQDSLKPDQNPPTVAGINGSLLEFKINEEFRCMQVGENFEFAIIDNRDQTVIKGKHEKYTQNLLSSRHNIPMLGFRDGEYYSLVAHFPHERKIILQRMIAWLLVSLIFAVLLVLSFFYTLNLFYRQKKMSEIKTDFINNMTHEFKTPLATISLASEMLMNHKIREDQAKCQRYAKIIFDENSRLQYQVDQILSVALLEKGKFRLKISEVDVNALIQKIVENFELTVKEREGELKAHYCARRYMVMADKDHLTNVVINLLDNAYKYSPDKPWIRIGTTSTDQGLVISVEDRGIGVSPENQQHIFKNLYRVSTGNLYNFKGFGIGLYYVKTIIEAHGGHVNLTSEINKGSRFDVFLPFASKFSSDDHSNET